MTAFLCKHICLLLIIAVSVIMHFSEAVLFNRNLTGLNFNPHIVGFVKYMREIKYKHLKVMLEVASTRFSRILTEGMFAVFAENKTKIRTDIRAQIAEAAAHINRERNKSSLTVMIGIYDPYFGDDVDINGAIHIVQKVSQLANSIYPGTVEGVVIICGRNNTVRWASEILNIVKALRVIVSNPSIKIGTLQTCFDKYFIEYLNDDEDSVKLLELQNQIIMKSDFIICEITLRNDMMALGVHRSINIMQSIALQTRNEIRAINSNIEVMGYTCWKAPEAVESKLDIEDMKNFWLNVDNFAAKNNFTMWLREMFSEKWSRRIGWWKLRSYDLMDNFTGYEEKVSNFSSNQSFIDLQTYNNLQPKFKAANMTFETTVDIDNTTLLLTKIFVGTFSVLFTAVIIYQILRKLKAARNAMLTRHEIYQFRCGFSENDFCKYTNDDPWINSAALKLPYDNVLEISKENLLIGEEIGGGAHGCILKGFIRSETQNKVEVALKTTRPESAPISLKGLLSEIKILSYLRHHPNIIQILGAYTTEIKNGVAYLAMELCLESLKDRLKTCQAITDKTAVVPVQDLYLWSHGVACGMEYLEQMGVIHGDLAARNVLLSSTNVAKISDFGLSRRLYEYTVYTKTSREPLPWRWMSFESLKFAEFSTKSDVWSFGVLLWEIFSLGAQPYPSIGWTLEFLEFLENGFRLQKPTLATSEMYMVMRNCWELKRDARPAFKDLTSRVIYSEISDTDKSPKINQ